jgi:meso-butanediol dehydrogenase/(S,S)-butanediol dehydrogenase/diacetyl reductase
MEQRLGGKIAIVTGAGQGIGKGIAKRLAREGAQVIVAELNSANAAAVAAEIVEAGGRALPYALDIAHVLATQKMVDDIVDRLGRIDILVNNAGVAQTKPMLDLTETDWDRVLDVNLRGTFFVVQAVARRIITQLPEPLQAGSYGKIVSLSSVSGRRGRSFQAHYAASKAAIISLTQSAALALAPYRINANAVCPGIVATPMWKQIDEERARLFGTKPGEAFASFVRTVPLRRAATPGDVAGAVAFFCSPDSDYITGQALNVDGGFEMD